MCDLQTTNNVAIESFRITNRLSVSNEPGKPATLNIGDTKAAGSYGSVVVEWLSPRDWLTLTIETPYTKERTPFLVTFDDLQKHNDMTIQQIEDGKEMEAFPAGSNFTFHSDSRYQVVVKIPAPIESRYLIDIGYRFEPK